MNIPNKYPKKYPIAHRRNKILASVIALRPTKIIPNDPVMHYRYNDNTVHFYMHNRNQWWWCGYYLDK
jgi:hypothetical protein